MTFSLDQTIIENAKSYVKSNDISLSKLIGAYLHSLTDRNQEELEITYLVKSLSGIVKLPKDLDEKAAYSEYLIKKYK